MSTANKIFLVLFLAAGSAAAASESAPAEFIRSRINPKGGVSEDLPAAQAGDKFYRGRFKGASGEVLIRATSVADAQGGQSMALVESSNVQNLYRQRRNPYEGQITEVVKCNPKFGPHVHKIKALGQPSVLTCGGVNARKGFGACSREEMVRWGCHFAVYDVSAGLAIDVRVFSEGDAQESLNKIRKTAENLFTR